MDRKDLEGIEEKALQQFKSSKLLFGKDGAFAPLLRVLFIVGAWIDFRT